MNENLQIVKKFILLVFIGAMISCQEKTAPVSVKISSSSVDGYNYTFTATTSGDYGSLQWTVEGGENIRNEKTATAYYAKVGTYTVQVDLWKDGEIVASDDERIVISKQDPAYDYTLVWSDEFDGDKVSSAWTNETGYIANGELQDYQSKGNHEVSNGTLKIIAKKINEDKEFGSYTSARLKTEGKQEFKYGKIEARMKLPQGVGVWPAFWTLGGNISQVGWPNCGEIDIMEYVGFEPTTVHVNLHMEDFNHTLGNGIGSKKYNVNTAEWHTYGIIWDEKGISFYLDDASKPFFEKKAPAVKTLGSWPFDAPQFLILNLAIGGGWGGAQGIDNSIFPCTMEVDYVRVYQYL